MDMREVFQALSANNLTPNQYFLLWCIANKQPATGVNPNLEKKQLISEDMITADFKITPKGMQMIALIDANRGPSNVVVKSFDADEYLNLFPKGKLPSGKPARINKKTIVDSFTWFFKNYDYDWTTVIKATGMYVDEYEVKNYLYMRNSQYFIRKQNSDKTWESELANYCEMILSGDTSSDSHHFSENVV
jgi:hypothetical protein